MRRLPAVLASLLLALSAACAGNEPTTPATGDVDSAVTTTTPTAEATADGAAGTPATTPSPTTIPRPLPTAARAPESAPPATTRTTAAVSPAPGSTPAGDPAVGAGELDPRPADDGSKSRPGAFARTLLRPQPASTLVFERVVHGGADVAPSTLSRNAKVLGEVAAKPIDVRPPIELSGAAQSWTAEQLRATADRTARTSQGEGKAVLRLLVVRGSFEGDKRVLGAAIRGDIIVLFRDAIDATATPLVSARLIEDAVLLHEIGHVLGLVDIALDVNREDPEHPGHSKNRDSVMYWAVESDLIVQVLDGPPPNTFDAADLADLRALRGGA